MESQIARTPNGPIEYTLYGSGPTVLVCHGTSSNCYSNEIGSILADNGFSVLTPSRPGYGRTPIEVGRSAAEAAQALIGLLDCLQISTCAVGAVSGGGPTGLALAAANPGRVNHLMLVAAVSRPEERFREAGYKNQMSFYGPMHNLTWGMLGLMSRLSPRSMARQTLSIFSTHDPNDGLSKLSETDVQNIAKFYRGRSSRAGALNDAAHTVGKNVLQNIGQPTLVIHSREDASVPFSHAEWSLQHIPGAQLCEAGFTGHFFWIGPDFTGIRQRMVGFLKEGYRL